MNFDLVVKGRQSVLRTVVLVPHVFVFLFGSAKIGQTAMELIRDQSSLAGIESSQELQFSEKPIDL